MFNDKCLMLNVKCKGEMLYCLEGDVFLDLRGGRQECNSAGPYIITSYSKETGQNYWLDKLYAGKNR